MPGHGPALGNRNCPSALRQHLPGDAAHLPRNRHRPRPRYGELAFLKSRLSDSGPAGKLGGYTPLVHHLPQLRRIDRTTLPGREQAWLDTAIWVGERVSEAGSFAYGQFSGYPIPYAITQLTGSYQNVPDFLDSQHKIETRADADAYVARLEAFAANISLEIDQTRADAGRGVVPPGFILDKALAQTRTLRAERGQESGLVRSLVRRTREKGIAGDWGTQAAAIVDGRIAAALDRQLAVLTELRRGAAPARRGAAARRRALL